MLDADKSESFNGSSATSTLTQLSKRRVKILREWISRKAQNRPYGCIILRNGLIGAEFYGGGFTADSLFEIGSIRKSFNSALIGNGIKDGKVNLDVNAADIWPELVQISGQPKDRHITLH